MADSSGGWLSDAVLAASFSCILVGIEEFGRSVANAGPTMPGWTQFGFVVGGITLSFLGKKGHRLWRKLWDRITSEGLREENRELRLELEKLKNQPNPSVATDTNPGVPLNAANLVWNWRRMVTNAHNKAREEKTTFAAAVVRDSSYSDLRPHLRKDVRDAVEGVQIIGSQHNLRATVDPLFTSVSDDVERTAREWNLPTEPIVEEIELNEALENCRAELQAERERNARPVIDVSWGETETRWQKGFTLVYSGGDDPLMNVTIKPISNGDYTATFNTIPFLRKSVPAYLIPEVTIKSEPQVKGDLKSLLEYQDLLTSGVIAFSVVGLGPRPFAVPYRAEGHYAHDVITVFPESRA